MALVGGTIIAIQGTAILKINCGTEMVQVVPNWWYRNGTGGGPEHDITFCVVPKWTGTETDHPVARNGLVPNGTYPLAAILFCCWCLHLFRHKLT